MHIELMKKLCCPLDKGDLELEVIKQTDRVVREGILTCAVCGRYYPIIAGIPVMTPDEYREKALEEPTLKRWGYQVSGERFKLDNSLTGTGNPLLD